MSLYTHMILISSIELKPELRRSAKNRPGKGKFIKQAKTIANGEGKEPTASDKRRRGKGGLDTARVDQSQIATPVASLTMSSMATGRMRMAAVEEAVRASDIPELNPVNMDVDVSGADAGDSEVPQGDAMDVDDSPASNMPDAEASGAADIHPALDAIPTAGGEVAPASS